MARRLNIDPNEFPRELPNLWSKLKSPKSDQANLSDVFAELTRAIQRRYAIEKGVLVLRQEETNHLAAIATWEKGSVRTGLALTLPIESSLFEKVARSGQVYGNLPASSFEGNFFEQKLLMNPSSASFILQPLTVRGQVVGLIGFSSQRPEAFSDFVDGMLDGIAAQLAAMVDKKLTETAL
jgi:GAF domain-containing protein